MQRSIKNGLLVSIRIYFQSFMRVSILRIYFYGFRPFSIYFSAYLFVSMRIYSYLFVSICINLIADCQFIDHSFFHVAWAQALGPGPKAWGKCSVPYEIYTQFLQNALIIHV